MALLCAACSTARVGEVEPPAARDRSGWVIGSLVLAPSLETREELPLETGPPSRSDYTLLARRGSCASATTTEYAWDLQWNRERVFALNLPAGRYRFCRLIRRSGGGRVLQVPLAFRVVAGAQDYLGRIVLSPPPRAESQVELRVEDDRSRAVASAFGSTPEVAPGVELARPQADAKHVEVCAGLARAFFLVAQQRERGKSRQDQARMVEKSVDSPFVTRPHTTANRLLEIVDFVYLYYPDSSPGEVELAVLDNCVANERGHAVLPRPQAIQ